MLDEEKIRNVKAAASGLFSGMLGKDVKINIIKYEGCSRRKENPFLKNYCGFDTNIDVDLIKEKFKLVGDTYIFEDTNSKIMFYYFPQMSLINLRKIKSKGNYEELNFYIKENYIVYKKFKDNNITNSFSYEDNQYICLTSNCNFDKEKIKYFFTKLNDILGKN